eukprot:CAMPEP_0205819478 /NCGR_PEP_ID=MMETSP0206-20130828/1867_1 /ASSEMBLY_ACC=CAM_ASM_000279 /TAXON_ID=36767 /ORGANISM="Euplotes focardii, Strain TN1" /LENGTH=1118 /DNA_ID=CAMNT_0053113125 /DNA_START=29 /DNA_END=3385 /DNA_ORIENTATION=+
MADGEEQQVINTKFGVKRDDLVDLIELYRGRKFDEDLKGLKGDYNGVEGIAEKLHSDPRNGIIPNDLDERDEAFGSNKKEPSKRNSFCKLFLMALDDFMLKVLIVAAVISLIVSMIFEEDHREIAWVEGAAILVAVFVVSFVTAFNDYKKEEQFQKLNAYNDAQNNVNVMREGKRVLINFDEIKVGDIVQVEVGMNIPCDAILIRGSGVTTDESAMTGESIELKKESLDMCEQRLEEKVEEEKFSKGGAQERTNHDLPSPILLSGTQIQTGEGWFLIVVCGKHSCLGKIMAKLSTKIETTPLQDKLDVIATDIGKLGMVAAAITVFVLFARFFIEEGIDGYEWGDKIGDYIQEWFEFIIIGITIVVVAVPEGLPLAVMISLAYSVRKMLKDMNFVKRLASCEIMGGANNICSDKTGTLTKNEMTVTNFWQGDEKILDVEDDTYVMGNYIPNAKTSKLFLEACACNTIGTSSEANATEKAMLKMLDKFECDYEEMRSKHLKEPFVRFPFTSRRKKMGSVLTEIDDNEYRYDKRLHVKGAAEYVLNTCSHYLNENGERVQLSDTKKDEILNEVITHFAKSALRTICLAYKDLKESEGGVSHEDDHEDGINKVVEKMGLTCISILGIRDIIRPEVPDAVDQCQKAGIKVRMVTGDNKTTALAIAKQCNIIGTDHPDAVMEGPEFFDRVGGLYCENCKQNSPCDCPDDKVDERVKNKEEFISIWKNLEVLARSRPEDKYLLVTGIREMGDVVAVTGDGTNDAPALKKADVGFAMGITGTDVAKHAADIILLDDNFASIVKACMWGRNIYDNIRRFLQFQLTVNVVALISAFVGSCILRESPLQPIQLLWVNLIMDSLASLALATEPPKPDLLNRPPHSRDDYIVSRKMVKHILVMSVYQSIIVFLLVFSGEYWIPEEKGFKCKRKEFVCPGRAYDWDSSDLYKKLRDGDDDPGPSRQYTVVFTAFVLMQIFNMLNARKIHDEFNIFAGVFQNTMFVVIWIIILILQVLITQFTQDVFVVSRDGLYWGQWLLCFAIGISVIPLDALIKFLPDTICPEIGKKKKGKNGNKDVGPVLESGGHLNVKQNDDKAATGFGKAKEISDDVTPNADKSSGEDRALNEHQT